jgi:hypothetical protein
VRYNPFTVSIEVMDTVLAFSNISVGSCFVPAVRGFYGDFERPAAPQRVLLKTNTGRAAQLDRPCTRFALPNTTPVCLAVLRIQPRFESEPAVPIEALRPLPRGPAAANHEEER